MLIFNEHRNEENLVEEFKAERLEEEDISQSLQANVMNLLMLEGRISKDKMACLQVHVPHVGNIGAHLALRIASRVNRFGVLKSKFSEMKLELLEGIALVKKLNKLGTRKKDKSET